MTNYYIKKETYGTMFPHIINEKIMNQARHEKNELDANDYVFYCKADNIREAEERYSEEFSYLFLF